MKKARRHENLKNADDSGWEKYTEFHWYKSYKGQKVDYWPSTRKVMFNGEVFTNVLDVNELIKERLK